MNHRTFKDAAWETLEKASGSPSSRLQDWDVVIRELHADRGSMLGSAQWDTMNGVEKAKALGAIDEEIEAAYVHKETIRARRETTFPVSPRFGFTFRAMLRKRRRHDDELELRKIAWGDRT